VILALATIRRGEIVRGRRRQEREFRRDPGWQRRTAEQVHQLAERHSVHCKRIGGGGERWTERRAGQTFKR